MLRVYVCMLLVFSQRSLPLVCYFVLACLFSEEKEGMELEGQRFLEHQRGFGEWETMNIVYKFSI